MKKLALLLCLFARCCFGLTGELIIDWEGVTQNGAFAYATAPSYTHGSYDSWNGSGTRSRFTIVADDLGYSFPRPVVVGGVTYTGSGSNVLKNNCGAGGADQNIDFYFPGAVAAPSVASVATACLVRFDTSNDTATSINLDLFYFYPVSGGNWSVTQLQLDENDGALQVAAHTNLHGVGGGVVQKNKTYFMVHYRNASAHTATVSLYDPATNFALVATETSDFGTAENVYLMQLVSGYFGDPPGTITYGDIVMLYEPTAQELIDLVTPVVASSTITVGTLHIGN